MDDISAVGRVVSSVGAGSFSVNGVGGSSVEDGDIEVGLRSA